MSTDQTQRPRFYEKQYLGAADLEAAIDYGRLRAARHNLGAHTWGIAAGLQLKEEPALAGDGAVDVFLQPGYAIDGFGRPLVVTTPCQIPAARFEEETTGPVPVWIRYSEQTTDAPGYGFEVCDVENQNRRVVETFEIVVGDVSSGDQRDDLSVAGQAVDAIEALNVLDEDDPLLCDGSIPFQAFPEPGEARWLIPLGYVNWEAGSPGRLVQSDEQVRRDTRSFRRYLGVVAEGLHAADGVLRLRARDTDPPAAGESIFSVCEEDVINASGDVDLLYDEDTQRATPAELVWVEGHLRVEGDTRLFGGRLEFRDDEGKDHDAPLWLQRNETNGLGGTDLRVLVGESDDGRNRFTIGQLTVDDEGTESVTDQVVVQDDGKVGIGIPNQADPLQVPLTIRALGDNEDLLRLEDPDGNPAWEISQQAEGNAGLTVAEPGDPAPGLFLQEGGNLGVSTSEPEAKLDVSDVSGTSGGSALGTDLWLRAGNGGDGGRFWVEYGSQAAPLLVLSDEDDPPRLQFQQTGDGEEAGPDFSSWIGHAQGNSSDIAVMNGSVGLGTTSPAEQLDVRGNIKLSSSGNLFAMGALENLRVIAGQVSASGGREAGAGFTSESGDETGEYSVTFDDGFESDPVVLVSPVNALNDDNVVTVRSITPDRFKVRTKDVEAASEGYQNTAFTFIALGIRL